MTEQTPIVHALLIGIDHYKPNPIYRSLKGAVRDINLVETFLKTGALEVPAERIHKLTAPNQEDAALQEARSAKDQEPTYENIVNGFKKITEIAQPGEQVYIHYAGHGGRATTVYPNLKRGSGTQNDEGIVPMDVGITSEGRYLRDVEMTTLLKRMTDKGLIVTVILDSCHSGGSTRGDAEIRGGIQTDTLTRTGDSLVASREELERNWLEETRYQGVGAAGLPQSRNYVLLAACRADESAYEYAANGGTEKNGALTYWMIDTLTTSASSGLPLTYKLLHDRVNAKIQSQFPAQIPMISGESDRLVLGSDRWTTPFTVSVIKVLSPTQITLNAGQAQGLSKGTRFSIYPLNTTDFTDNARQVAIVELTIVNAAESIARVLKPEEGGISASIDSNLEGAPATMASAPVELIQRVRLTSKTAGEGENQIPSNLVSLQKEALNKVRLAMVGNGWVGEEKENESALFQVAIDRQGNYEICKGLPIPNLRPFLSTTSSTAPQQVVDRLVHLAKYQAVQSLDNSGSKLAQAIEVELLQEDGTPFSNPQNPIIYNGETVCLRLTNKGNEPLKIAVLDIEPTWAVTQLPIGGMESPFFDLDKGAVEEVPLTMSLPDDTAYQQATESFKVFAIRRGLADFRWLTLSALDQPPAKRSAKLDLELAEQVAASRGQSEGVNPLNNLLKMIGDDLDKAPNATRAATIVLDPKQDWVTKQVQIVVKR